MGWLDWAAVAGQDVHTWRGFWTVAVGCSATFVAGWACVSGLLKLGGAGPTICGAKRGSWALKISMLLHHVPISAFTFYALCQDEVIRKAVFCFGCEEAAQSMLRAPSEPVAAAAALIPVTIGYMLGDLMLLGQWNLSKGGMVENMLMVAHHVLSMISWPTVVYYDFCARYVMILLMYEFSSVFLILNWMLSTAGMKKSPLYFASGILFTLSFVVMRMFGAVPQLLMMWHRPPWIDGAALGMPLWSTRGSAFLIIPHILNTFWGVKVVKGFLAVALGGGKKDKKEEKKDE
eukprot:TRINITY_DN86870_c0_g1_i1.p1 TRINITY_DN86870_c0_g1~~TRINITY_DN86870_c0_g1_i1.p1  ORF type:complete len:290 (-),score=67.86 TRINITY_DN86870_c0_g1_i1:110-979(-)